MANPEIICDPTDGPSIKLRSADGTKTYEFSLTDAGSFQINGSDVARIKTSTYTGDGTTSNAITGIGFQPKYLRIWRRQTADANARIIETTDTIVDDNANGMAFFFKYNGTVTDITAKDNRVKTLDADGFTVSDDGTDLSPNKDTIVYNYLVMG